MEKEKNINICFYSILGEYNISDNLYESAQIYKDFFAQLYANQNLPYSIHLTGDFIHRLQQKDQSFSGIISDLLSRKQIELIGGGYFSPLFSMIPASDIIGQLEMLTNAIRKYFNTRPKGIFLPFSAWKPSMITALKKNGAIEYCLLDHRYFTKADLNPYKPACIEEGGKRITVAPYESINNLANISPQDFYESLMKKATTNTNKTIIILLTPTDLINILKKEKQSSWFLSFLDIVNLDGNKVEISKIWSTITKQQVYPRGFIEANLIRNDKLENVSINKMLIESNHAYTMYNKLLQVHTLANQVRGDKQRKKNALESLWQAESASFFTEGAFNPLENKILRNKCYKHLIMAERTTRISGVFSNSLIPFDFNMDGLDEYLSQREKINMYVTLFGGKIFECDFIPASKNYADIPYGDNGMFIDNIITENDLNEILLGNEVENIFSENKYDILKCNRGKCTLKLQTNGIFKNQKINLRKEYSFSDTGTCVQYIIKNDSENKITAYFMVEIDISVNEHKNKIPTFTVYVDNKKHEMKITSAKFENISWLQINDCEVKTKIFIDANENPNLIVMPINYANTEKLLGLKTFFYWKFDLEPLYETEKMVFLKIDKIDTQKTSN